MKIVEIFSSIDGEGIRTGYLCTFIRTYGCNLRCNYCDSLYASTNNNYSEMSISEIVKKCSELGNERITLTGGEPLIQPNVIDLISCLLESGFEVNIETNGSVDIFDIRSKVNLRCLEHIENLFFTIDFKCPGSGMNSEMQMCNFIRNSRRNDVVKFVVSDRNDLDTMRTIVGTMTEMLKSNLPYIFVSPVFGRIKPVEIVDYLKEYSMQTVRVQLQIHKLIWDPNERGV